MDYGRKQKTLLTECYCCGDLFRWSFCCRYPDTDAYSEELDKLGIELEKVMEQLKE